MQRRGLEFRLLGPVEVVDAGAAVALGGPKQRALLAELLLSRGAAVPRERLVDALWGDHPPASANNSLQVYVHSLRRALGADRVERQGTAYRILVEPDEVDLTRFEELVARARTALTAGAPGEAGVLLAAALDLWRGDALGDLGESPVRAAAAALEELRLQAFELSVEAKLALGEHGEVLPLLEQAIAGEPYRERLWEQLVLALYRAGRQHDALAAYQDVRRRLADDLGVEPGPALRALERAVLRQDDALELRGEIAAYEPRLPTAPTPLVGRRLELAALTAILRDPATRLVTLTGPGGTGKTRLALASAEDAAAQTPCEATFVDLSSIRDASLISGAIATSLRLDDTNDLLNRLRDRALLLVLDNLEQIAEPAAAVVAQLLASAPRLRILATSRIPLRVRGEHEYPVPPLPLADPGSPFDELSSNEAVRLFTARAAAAGSDLELSPATAPVVARICARLDGLPLAIELAAARLRTLSLQALERRVERALDVLVSGARDLPVRQQTLRATLNWSFDLLNEDAKALLLRLSVFADGSSLDAVEDVGGARAVDALEALREASLVRRRGERYHLLETIREYAYDRLTASGEQHAARAAHASYFLRVAEAAWRGVLAGGEMEVEGMRALDLETENMRTAIAYALETGEDETLVRLAEAHRWYWLVRGRFLEARAVYARAVAADVADLAHAGALNGAATFAAHVGQFDEARAMWEEALEIFVSHDNEPEAARCIAELGGVAVSEGDLELAYSLYREAAARFRACGSQIREAIALSNLASIALDLGDLDQSIEHAERAIELQRTLGDHANLALSLASVAPTYLRRGELELCRAHLREAVELAAGYGYALLLAHSLAVAAELAAADGDPTLAARLVGASDAAFATIDAVVPDAVRAAFMKTLEQSGADADDLVAKGRLLSVPDALAAATTILGVTDER